MKPSSLISWLEADGSFSLICKRNDLNPRLLVQITQKDTAPLIRMRQELGIGDLTLSQNNSNTYALRFRRINDLEILFSILDQGSREDWFTHKYDQFVACKEFLKFRSQFDSTHRWKEDEIKYLLKLRRIISPKYKISDEEIWEIWRSRDYREFKFDGTPENLKLRLLDMRSKKMKIKDILKELGISVRTLYNWYHKLEIL